MLLKHAAKNGAWSAVGPNARPHAQGFNTRQEAVSLKYAACEHVLRKSTRSRRLQLHRNSEWTGRSVSRNRRQRRVASNMPNHTARYPNATLATMLINPIHGPPAR